MSNYIHPTALISDRVTLGDNIYIGPYCVIGFAPEHPDIDPNGPCGTVQIMDGCILYKHVTIDASMLEDGCTVIGENCRFMAHSHVGHDCRISNNVTLACGAKIGGHSILGYYSYIGLNAVVHQRSSVNTGTIIGASAFFKGWTYPYEMWAGVPAKHIGMNERLMKKLGVGI